MADEVEQGQRNGLSRRQMIKASAIAGAAAWTAPVIIDSLASPAAAGSQPLSCSWVYVVFTIAGDSTVYFTGAQGPSSTCGTFAAAPGGPFCKTCNGVTYTLNKGPGDLTYGPTCGSGTAITNIDSVHNCASYIDISANKVSVVSGSGATIITAFSHPGGGTQCAACGTFTELTICGSGACDPS